MLEAHEHPDLRTTQRRALWMALSINAVYMVVEVIGGLAFNSLALLADAGHMLADVLGLSIALVAQALTTRPASVRHTYGLQRAEALGALANGVVLVVVIGWIFYQSLQRFADPQPIAGVGLLIVAGIGLAINVASAAILARSAGRSLNMRGALLHMVSDAAGSVAVIVAAVAVILWGATWIDPAASIAIGSLILWATWRLLRESVQVLMEGTPRGMSAAEIESAIASHDHVESVHHLHLWNLASDVPALSAHVVLEGELTLHEAQRRGENLKEMLAERFGIEHTTLDLECHPCPPEVELARQGRAEASAD